MLISLRMEKELSTSHSPFGLVVRVEYVSRIWISPIAIRHVSSVHHWTVACWYRMVLTESWSLNWRLVMMRACYSVLMSHSAHPMVKIQFCDGLLEIHALSYPTLQTLYDLILAIVLLWSVREISSVSVCPFSLNGSGMTKPQPKPTSVLSMI